MSEKILLTNLSLEREGEKIAFDLVIQNSSLAFGRRVSVLFQRILINHLETWAFDQVEIYQNDSIYPDEVIALHLGLLPLYLLKEPEIIKPFELAITATEDMAVKSDHFTVGPDWLLLTPKFPLCILEKGQTLILRAWPAAGKGINHSKWSPVSIVAASQLKSPKELPDFSSSNNLEKEIRFGYRVELTGRLDHNLLLERAKDLLNQQLEDF